VNEFINVLLKIEYCTSTGKFFRIIPKNSIDSFCNSFSILDSMEFVGIVFEDLVS